MASLLLVTLVFMMTSQLYVGVKRADELLVRKWLMVMMAQILQILASFVAAVVYLGFGISDNSSMLLIWSGISAVAAGESPYDLVMLRD